MSHIIEIEKGYLQYGPADDRAYPVAPSNPPLRQLGNAGPLGLSATAATTFLLSLICLSARNVTTPNIVLGMAFFYGGLCQLLAGMWEYACGNTFGGTAFSSYGGFWLSYAVILTPAFNVIPSYPDKQAANNALAFYLFAWFIFTTLMLICTLRTNVAFVLLFFALDMTFLFIALADYQGSPACKKAGGIFGIVTASTAWYCALAAMLTKESSFFLLPMGVFPWVHQPGKRA